MHFELQPKILYHWFFLKSLIRPTLQRHHLHASSLSASELYSSLYSRFKMKRWNVYILDFKRKDGMCLWGEMWKENWKSSCAGLPELDNDVKHIFGRATKSKQCCLRNKKSGKYVICHFHPFHHITISLLDYWLATIKTSQELRMLSSVTLN